MKLRLTAAAGVTIGILVLLAGCPGPEPGPVAPTEPPPVDAPPEDPPADPMPAVPFDIVRGADEPDERGWRAEIVIAMDGAEIVAVDYDEFDDTDQRKSMAEAYAERWMEQVPGMHPARAFKQLEVQLIATNVADEVDVVTGATGTSERFIAIARQALGQ